METNFLFVGALAWVACGIGGAGFINAEFRGTYPDLYRRPEFARIGLGESLLMGLLWGPIALVVGFFTSGFGYHGWTLSGAPLEGQH